ncbi:MAG TPA: hypothetical protein PKE40_04445 [Arachnia sp.]|nr:hypothetical protein [Arachnia sp.]HMT85582.1 hypothetical protein [Arachnia sp.]
MTPRQPLPAWAHRLLVEQEGVITASQLLASGLTRRVCARVTSQWTRLAPGLYLTETPSFESATWAAVLHGGPCSVLGSTASLYLNAVLRDAPDEVVIWVPGGRRTIKVGKWLIRPRRGVRPSRGSPPRLPVEEGLLDLARDSSVVGTMDAIARGFARSLTTPERVVAALDAQGRVRYGAEIRQMCSASASGIESGLEWLFARDVIGAHRLPIPSRQARSDEGRMDCHFDGYRVIAELDGMRDHGDWSKDMLRDNAHALRLGVVTLRYGWHAVLRRPCLVAGQVADALTLRGWSGSARRCRRCHPASTV